MVKEIKITKKLTFILLLAVLSTNVFASNNIEPAGVHNDSSFENVETTDANDEEVLESYKKSIAEAFESVSMPEVANLPSLFSQPTFHPYDTDFFGKDKDSAPIFRVKVEDDDTERQNCMCITFDSAYVNKFTYQILDILDKYNIKSTFFMTYEFMSNNSEQVLEVIKRGHEVANHSTTHPDLNKVTDAKVVMEVMQAHNYIKNLVGIDMCLFRYPFGSYSPRTLTLLKNMGYYPIQWSADSVDWKNTGKEFLVNRFSGNDMLYEGAIVLFHNGATYTPEALPEIIEKIQKRGLKCVRVSDLIYRHDFYIDTGVQFRLNK